jgi:hypothetical protein
VRLEQAAVSQIEELVQAVEEGAVGVLAVDSPVFDAELSVVPLARDADAGACFQAAIGAAGQVSLWVDRNGSKSRIIDSADLAVEKRRSSSFPLRSAIRLGSRLRMEGPE